MSNFDWAVECVLHHEGGFVDHPSDPGGATNWGISLRFLKSVGDLDGDGLPDGDLDGDGDVDYHDIKHATRNQAIQLYRTHFWAKNSLGHVRSSLVATKVFDMAVNMGNRQAAKLLQRSCNKLGSGLIVDGLLGPATLTAVESYYRVDYDLVTVLRDRQANFYEALIEKTPSFADFRLGWRRRAAF